MDFSPLWQFLLLSVWIHVGCEPDEHQRDGRVPHLSGEDVLLLKDEEDPKCFTRTEWDFTCFFETSDNKTYDFYYKTDEEKRCNLTSQLTEGGSVLHICTFPPFDIYMYVLTHLRVLELSTNTTVHARNVSVEDQVLRGPPVNVSLHRTGRAGQLRAAWHVDRKWENRVHYGTWYSSQQMREMRKEGQKDQVETLKSLVPGEVLQFQIRTKHGFDANSGHWSRWSQPVLAMVPQSAGDISLECFTFDLKNITCRWNENMYEQLTFKLFYRIGHSEALGWTECLSYDDSRGRCSFHGNKFRPVWVKLGVGTALGPLDRTFYSDPFTLNNSIKTAPPGHLKRAMERGELCLSWEAPLPALSHHLQYQVQYQTRDGGPWTTVSPKGSGTRTCLEGLMETPFSVQVRARPGGTVYSGTWSDWSQRKVHSDGGAILFLFPCILLTLLVMPIVFKSLFLRFFSKLQQHLWPPIPNLDKVLQSFLTEINGQTWDPVFPVKLWSEESPESVVEFISEEEEEEEEKEEEDEGSSPGSGSVKPHRGTAPPPRTKDEEGSSAGARTEEELSGPDYVTLNGDNVATRGNEYVYERVAECGGPGRRGCSVRFPSCTSSSSTDILNRCYLLLDKPADVLVCSVGSSRGSGNLYTNVELVTN